MKSEPTKRSLSVPRQMLVELMQGVNFGRIEGLAIRHADPVLDPPPRVVKEVRFGLPSSPREERSREDFSLKKSLLELFDILDRLGDGTIEVLEIRDGLPVRAAIPGLVGCG